MSSMGIILLMIPSQDILIYHHDYEHESIILKKELEREAWPLAELEIDYVLRTTSHKPKVLLNEKEVKLNYGASGSAKLSLAKAIIDYRFAIGRYAIETRTWPPGPWREDYWNYPFFHDNREKIIESMEKPIKVIHSWKIDNFAEKYFELSGASIEDYNEAITKKQALEQFKRWMNDIL